MSETFRHSQSRSLSMRLYVKLKLYKVLQLFYLSWLGSIIPFFIPTGMQLLLARAPTKSSVEALNYFHFLKTISSIKAVRKLSGGQECLTWSSHGGDYGVHHQWGFWLWQGPSHNVSIVSIDKTEMLSNMSSLNKIMVCFWLLHVPNLK